MYVTPRVDDIHPLLATVELAVNRAVADPSAPRAIVEVGLLMDAVILGGEPGSGSGSGVAAPTVKLTFFSAASKPKLPLLGPQPGV